MLKHGGHRLGRPGRPDEPVRHGAAGGAADPARRDRGRRTRQPGAAPEVRGDRAAGRAPSSGSSRWWTTPRRGRSSCRCPRRPASHVVLLGGGPVLMSTSAPRSRELFEARGLRVVATDISEFEKLEGCVTCLSVRLALTAAARHERDRGSSQVAATRLRHEVAQARRNPVSQGRASTDARSRVSRGRCPRCPRASPGEEPGLEEAGEVLARDLLGQRLEVVGRAVPACPLGRPRCAGSSRRRPRRPGCAAPAAPSPRGSRPRRRRCGAGRGRRSGGPRTRSSPVCAS